MKKLVIGFISFTIMVILIDLITGYVGKDLVINEVHLQFFRVGNTWFIWNGGGVEKGRLVIKVIKN